MKNIIWPIVAIVVLVISFYGGYSYRGEVVISNTDTIVKIRIDTLRLTQIKLVKEILVDSIAYKVPDTIKINDTLYLPRTQREYKEDEFRAWVSGYKPELDSIHVYPKTIEKTVTIQSKPRKWGIGVLGGYGVSNKGFTPVVGVGLYYRIF